MPGGKLEVEPALSGYADELLEKDHAKQGAVCEGAQDDRWVGGVPHQEQDAKALHEGRADHTADFKAAHVARWAQDEVQRAGEVDDEDCPNRQAGDPGGEGGGVIFLGSLHLICNQPILNYGPIYTHVPQSSNIIS